MPNSFLKPKPISPILQLNEIRKLYSEIIESSSIHLNVLTCVIKLKPSRESAEYKVKITYKTSDGFPKVWLLSPKIESYNGKLPHHVYWSDSKQHPRLCVYYPAYNEWDSTSMYIATSFIPWVLTWLNAYEYWLITGKWLYNEAPQKRNVHYK